MMKKLKHIIEPAITKTQQHSLQRNDLKQDVSWSGLDSLLSIDCYIFAVHLKLKVVR